MTEDRAGCRTRADSKSGRSDLTRAIVVVGLTAVAVIALVGPASRDLRPALLGDVASIDASLPSTDQARPTIVSSVRGDWRPTAAGDDLALPDGATVAGEPPSACVPCLDTGRPSPRRRTTPPAKHRVDAGKPADGPEPGRTDGSAASPPSRAQEPTTPQRPAAESTPPRADRRAEPKAPPAAAPAADGRGSGRSTEAQAQGPGAPADAKTSPADDRPGNDPSSPSKDTTKKASR
jgi:hypothetical protein